MCEVGGGGGGRVKDLFRKYGRVALGVHLVVYATFFAGALRAVPRRRAAARRPPARRSPPLRWHPAGCYVAVDSKADVRGLLARVGLLSERSYDEAEAEAGEAGKGSWLERAASGGGSSLALAFICNKALFPVRTPITLALTPPVARCARLFV